MTLDQKFMLQCSIERFFDIHDNFRKGYYNYAVDVRDEKYKEAMLEAMNVMMMTVLKELED